MKLEEIGFYTLCDSRARNVSGNSPMWRCEMILTNRCNFKCPYCRGLKVLSEDCTDDMKLEVAMYTLEQWMAQGLKNVRFSGGEPTLYPRLRELVMLCKRGCSSHPGNVQHIAISTNGSNDIDVYHDLINCGVNDFSISLDACCASFGDQMAGVSGCFEKVVENIKRIAKRTYVTVGVVLTEKTVHTAADVIRFAHKLGVADIRIISAAQYDQLVKGLETIEDDILDAHPILKYRIRHFREGRNVRGIQETDCHKCHLVKDDSVVAGRWHFPCVIHMREGGKPIGEVGPKMREDRLRWFQSHDSYADPICQKNCLDVCIDYNNKCERLQS
jgi:molybdenum cofactor biosynthesis enzyme MoaA